MNFIKKQLSSYAEESQPNPLQWQIFVETPAGFEPQCSWIICKDFFNDYVLAYQTKQTFGIYGFNVGQMKVPEKGQPIYIGVRRTNKHFVNNLEAINTWLVQQGLPAITCTRVKDAEPEYLLTFPEYYFSSTYRVSLITLMIRLGNDAEFQAVTFDDFVTYQKFAPRDQNKWKVAVDAKWFFQIPKHQEYIWYCGPEHNNQKIPNNLQKWNSYIHNNGLISWTQALQREKV